MLAHTHHYHKPAVNVERCRLLSTKQSSTFTPTHALFFAHSQGASGIHLATPPPPQKNIISLGQDIQCLWNQFNMAHQAPSSWVTFCNMIATDTRTCSLYLRWQMEERPPIRRIAANISNKQWRTADKGVDLSLGTGRGANNSSL